MDIQGQSEVPERRQGGDRRLHIRGGRRSGDQLGYTPLVFVVTDEPSHLRFWEALLLNLKFAVVPCTGPEPALQALKALRPDVIVASSGLHNNARPAAVGRTGSHDSDGG